MVIAMAMNSAYYPMLASPGTVDDLSKSNYIFEPKLDGIRCIALISGGLGSPILLSRTHKNISQQFPDVIAQLRRIRTSCVLDGEIIVRDLDAGRSAYACDFQALQTRLQRIDSITENAIETPAEFIAFDCLESSGFPLIGTPWSNRRYELDLICQHYSTPTTIVMDSKTALAQWPRLIDDGCEGFMAKERGSRYVCGTRSKEWLKIKPYQESEFIVGGITHGYGRRANLFGGLIVGDAPYARIKAGTHFGVMEFRAIVGSGLTDADMARLLAEFKIVPNSPFLPDPIPNVKHWVDPDHIARVRFQDVTREGRLRFPSLVSLSRLYA